MAGLPIGHVQARTRFQEPEFDFIPFNGGLDLVTRPIQVAPGYCREAQNYEIAITGGYARIKGYERYDGRTSPSSATYAVLRVTITGSFSVSDTITGVTSAATAVVIAVAEDDDGDYLVITKVSGTFESAGETLNVSGSPEGASTASPVTDGASTTALHATYNNLAADNYRADISAPTGSGALLGCWMLDDEIYVFRNNAGGTAAGMWKATSSGWSAVALGRELTFTSGGTYEIAEGDTITGATSGATAVVTRVVAESGSWAAGTAGGRLIFASQTGTFQSENLNVGANLNVATIAGNSSAITLLPDGDYEFENHNFGNIGGTKRMYGVDGANRAFEFDGTVFVPIDTGMDTDTPEHVRCFKGHLFLSFGHSAQHSGIGTPYVFAPIFGAGEISAGENITAFMVEPGGEYGGALAILSRNLSHVLIGTSSADWNLVRYRECMGAFEHTVQQMVQTMLLDDRGITTFQTSQRYGNFKHAALSNRVHTWLNQRRGTATASCVVRDKNQYRLFFADEYALYCTFDGEKLLGIMPVLLADKVECMFSLELSSGAEMICFGSDDGMLYQMEKGTSFDGDAIEAFINLHFHHSKSPRVEKTYRSVTLEAAGEGYHELSFTYELGYSSTEISQPAAQTLDVSLAEVPRWDTFTWDNFYWDGQNLRPSHADLGGSAENISLIFRSNSDEYDAITLSGAMLRLLKRRQLRHRA